MDNTLYDWVAIWFATFDALVQSASDISGVDRETLEVEARRIHTLYGTPEYAHLLQELPSLGFDGDRSAFLERYGPAITASRAARTQAMRLYEGVEETLVEMVASGVSVVAYTETSAFYTALRLRWLKLDGVLESVYSPPDYRFPTEATRRALRSRTDDEYPLKQTTHHFTPAGHHKPDTSVLGAIVADSGLAVDEVLYVGDSLTKDVAMAQALGVNDVHAAYGVGQHTEEYELLRKVSHWTDDDIERERQLLAAPTVTPSLSVSSFAELLDHFDFAEHPRSLSDKAKPRPQA